MTVPTFELLSLVVFGSALLGVSLDAIANVSNSAGAQFKLNVDGCQWAFVSSNQSSTTFPMIKIRKFNNLKSDSQFIVYCKLNSRSDDEITYGLPDKFINFTVSWIWGIELYKTIVVPADYNHFIAQVYSMDDKPLSDSCIMHEGYKAKR